MSDRSLTGRDFSTTGLPASQREQAHTQRETCTAVMSGDSLCKNRAYKSHTRYVETLPATYAYTPKYLVASRYIHTYHPTQRAQRSCPTTPEFKEPECLTMSSAASTPLFAPG